MSNTNVCPACHQQRNRLGCLLCDECHAIYSDPRAKVSIFRERAIALALAAMGIVLPHRFEILLTEKDQQDIVVDRARAKVEKRNTELAQLNEQFNGSFEGLFEPRE